MSDSPKKTFDWVNEFLNEPNGMYQEAVLQAMELTGEPSIMSVAHSLREGRFPKAEHDDLIRDHSEEIKKRVNEILQNGKN